jgi:hypothetical protein
LLVESLVQHQRQQQQQAILEEGRQQRELGEPSPVGPSVLLVGTNLPTLRATATAATAAAVTVSTASTAAAIGIAATALYIVALHARAAHATKPVCISGFARLCFPLSPTISPGSLTAMRLPRVAATTT